MIIAFDYGEKRIGVAISDESNKFATALDFVPNRSQIKKVFLKDFPKGTDIKVIQNLRKSQKKKQK